MQSLQYRGLSRGKFLGSSQKNRCATWEVYADCKSPTYRRLMKSELTHKDTKDDKGTQENTEEAKKFIRVFPQDVMEKPK